MWERKKYKVLFLFFCICAGSSLWGVELSINQVKNSSFEYKSISDGTYGSLPLYWTRAYSGASSTFGISTSGTKHGEKCLFITDSSSSASAGLHSEKIPVTPGYSYILRGWAKRDYTSGASMYLRFYDAGDSLISAKYVNLGTANQWSSGNLTATAPEGSEYARVLLYSPSASVGTSYFDCISLVLADEHVGDGGFSAAAENTTPENWHRYGVESYTVVDESGNKFIRISDNSSTSSFGAYYLVPATPGTPYRFQANVRRASGNGYAKIYIHFFSKEGSLLSYQSTGSSSTSFTNVAIQAVAPANTAYARLLCYSLSTNVGSYDFDDISFTRNYSVVKYASPTGNGTEVGDSAANAAAYDSTSFWSSVNTAAATQPVRVVLLAGNYDQEWVLDGVGNSSNNILIEGETPYAVNFCGTTATGVIYYLTVLNCQNITFRHLHFTAEEDPNDLALEDSAVYDYHGVIKVGDFFSDPVSNVRFEGLSFVHLLLMAYDAMAVSGADTHDIVWEKCDWVTIGYDLYDHCIYNSENAYNLDFYDCYFQDCNGPYVRYRSGTYGNVENCTFISTGTQDTGDPQDRLHWAFIQVCAFVSTSHPDELLGSQFSFKNNSFTYEQTSARGFRAPYQLYVMGGPPSSQPSFYLVPLSIGQIIEDTTQSNVVRCGYIEDYFGIDPSTTFDISGNSYSGCWSLLFNMDVYPGNSNYWTNGPSETEGDNCDIDKLVGLD
jgi:hypothetical protein